MLIDLSTNFDVSNQIIMLSLRGFGLEQPRNVSNVILYLNS